MAEEANARHNRKDISRGHGWKRPGMLYIRGLSSLIRYNPLQSPPPAKTPSTGREHGCSTWAYRRAFYIQTITGTCLIFVTSHFLTQLRSVLPPAYSLVLPSGYPVTSAYPNQHNSCWAFPQHWSNLSSSNLVSFCLSATEWKSPSQFYFPSPGPFFHCFQAVPVFSLEQHLSRPL